MRLLVRTNELGRLETAHQPHRSIHLVGRIFSKPTRSLSNRTARLRSHQEAGSSVRTRPQRADHYRRSRPLRGCSQQVFGSRNCPRQARSRDGTSFFATTVVTVFDFTAEVRANASTCSELLASLLARCHYSRVTLGRVSSMFHTWGQRSGLTVQTGSGFLPGETMRTSVMQIVIERTYGRQQENRDAPQVLVLLQRSIAPRVSAPPPLD